MGAAIADPRLYKTYAIHAPRTTHTREAACEEYGCEFQAQGWTTKVDETTELGQRQAYYIRKQSGRRFKEYRNAGLTEFTFEPGQECFTPHRVSLDRPQLFLVQNGRGITPGQQVRVHQRPEDWVEDFQEHNDKVRKDREG